MNRRMLRLIRYRYSGPSATWLLAGPADLSSEPQLATFLAGPASGLEPSAGFLDSVAVPAWEDDGEAHPRAPSRPLTDYGHGWAA